MHAHMLHVCITILSYTLLRQWVPYWHSLTHSVTHCMHMYMAKHASQVHDALSAAQCIASNNHPASPHWHQ